MGSSPLGLLHSQSSSIQFAGSEFLSHAFSLFRGAIGDEAKAPGAVVSRVLDDLAAAQVTVLGKEVMQVVVRSTEGEVGDVQIAPRCLVTFG